MEPIASPQVSDPIYDRLELGQLDLQVSFVQDISCDYLFAHLLKPPKHLGRQELLGDSLVEAQHLKELQGLEQRRVTVLQEQSLCAATHADTLCADVTLTSTQTAQVTQRELAGKCCELAAACIDINRWKKQAALQQLRLVSVQEDLTHQKVYAEALSAECSRRQELNDNLQAQLQIQHQHSAKLDEQIAEAAAKSSDLQVTIPSSVLDI